MKLPRRHAIARAKLFAELADRCPASELNLHEAYLEAAIVFCRTAIHRLKSRYEKHAGWKSWFDSLRGNASIEFIRKERDFILKEAPPKVGQVVIVGGRVDSAQCCYYYESPGIPAVDSVRKHLAEVERIILEGESLFGGGRGIEA